MNDERLTFPAGISLGRNITATEVTCGAATVFQVICGNPHDMQKDSVFTKRCIPNGMRISK